MSNGQQILSTSYHANVGTNHTILQIVPHQSDNCSYLSWQTSSSRTPSGTSSRSMARSQETHMVFIIVRIDRRRSILAPFRIFLSI